MSDSFQIDSRAFIESGTPIEGDFVPDNSLEQYNAAIWHDLSYETDLLNMTDSIDESTLFKTGYVYFIPANSEHYIHSFHETTLAH